MSTPPNKQSVMTQVWLGLAGTALVVAMFTHHLPGFNKAIVDSAKSAVGLAISLAGITALWLGLVKIIEQAGFMSRLARWIAPLMRRLFPQIPPGHPANSAMTLSFAANLLGLGNAATPFGLKAMTLLDRLNPKKDTASDAMCLFLAITTSGLAILPTGVISIRMIAGSANPAGILIPTLLSTATATFVAILSCFILRRIFKSDFDAQAKTQEIEDALDAVDADVDTPELYKELKPQRWKGLLSTAFFALCFSVLAYQMFAWSPTDRMSSCLLGQGLGPGLVESAVACSGPSAKAIPVDCLRQAKASDAVSRDEAACLSDSRMNLLSTSWLIPLLLMWFVFYGWARNVDIYPVMVSGMKEGLSIMYYVVPFLLSIFLAMGVFRASGAMGFLTGIYETALSGIGIPPNFFPAEVLPIALTRPLSGSGASALMIELVNQAPDSFEAFMASVMAGSTDTTFYILAVYFGSVGVVKVRYAVVAGLLADFAGMGAAVLSSHLFY